MNLALSKFALQMLSRISHLRDNSLAEDALVVRVASVAVDARSSNEAGGVVAVEAVEAAAAATVAGLPVNDIPVVAVVSVC